MDAFNTLRKQAREKRDKTLAAARNEYAATLVRIAALEQDLNGRDPPAHRSIASCVESVIPTDRSFTTVDIMSGLEALDPRRVWRKRSVDSHIARLREKGLVIRLKRSQLRLPAVYVREGVEVESSPFGGHDAERGRQTGVGPSDEPDGACGSDAGGGVSDEHESEKAAGCCWGGVAGRGVC